MRKLENSPEKELNNQSKLLRRSSIVKTIGVSFTSALFTAGLINMMDGDDSDYKVNYAVPVESLPSDVLPIDSATIIVDNYNSIPVNDGSAIITGDAQPLFADTTSTTLNNTSPTSVDGVSAAEGANVLPPVGGQPLFADTTTTTLNPIYPPSPQPGTTLPPTTTTPTTTTVPATTLPPVLGMRFRTYENDADNFIVPGQLVRYVIELANLDPSTKTYKVTSGFKDSFALDRIINLSYQNCGNPVNMSGPLHVLLQDATIAPNATCSISFDAVTAFTGSIMQQYAEARGTSGFYTAQSDLLKS